MNGTSQILLHSPEKFVGQSLFCILFLSGLSQTLTIHGTVQDERRPSLFLSVHEHSVTFFAILHLRKLPGYEPVTRSTNHPIMFSITSDFDRFCKLHQTDFEGTSHTSTECTNSNLYSAAIHIFLSILENFSKNIEVNICSNRSRL